MLIEANFCFRCEHDVNTFSFNVRKCGKNISLILISCLKPSFFPQHCFFVSFSDVTLKTNSINRLFASCLHWKRTFASNLHPLEQCELFVVRVHYSHSRWQHSASTSTRRKEAKTKKRRAFIVEMNGRR